MSKKNSLEEIASKPYWVREECLISTPLNSGLSKTCVEREKGKITFTGKFEGENGDAIAEFYRAINDQTVLNLTDYLYCALYAGQSLYGINLAFNSKVYPEAGNLFSKGTTLISVRENKRIQKVYQVLHEDLEIGIVAKAMNSRHAEKFGTTSEEGGFVSVPPPSNTQEAVSMIKDFTDFIIEATHNDTGDSILSYWITSIVLKALQISGSKVARYLSAGELQSFVPDPKETASPPVVAWTLLIKIITTAIGLAGLIIRIIKKKKKKNRKKFTSDYVIIFSKQKSFKVYIGNFTLKNYEAYKQEVQKLFGKKDVFAFGIEKDLPVVGITKNGDLPIETVPEIFLEKMSENKISIKNLVITAEPRYIDYSL